MASPGSAPHAKFFVAILYEDERRRDRAEEAIVARWGPLDGRSEPLAFDCTDYYEPEMGAPLTRHIVSLARIDSPAFLVTMKLACNDLEDELRIDGRRTVNLDCGYCDHHKIVLGSAKEAGTKVYLDRGIYADMAARYMHGGFTPFAWSFPDFRDGRYDAFFLAVRERFLRERRELLRGDGARS